MAQFYLLSVLLNVLAGLILVYGKNLVEHDEEIDEAPSNTIVGGASLDSLTLRLVVGVLCVFVGLMKILSVFRNDIPVVGDLLPAIAGFVSGASILLEYYLSSCSDDYAVSDSVQKVFIDSRKYIGVGCFVVGLLHFVFPQVMLL